jgi:membrane-bound serine protease (ClpP class)
MQEFLSNPNFVYLLLVVGSIMLMMAIVTPGTHVLELGTALVLFLAGYGIVTGLGFNLWALIVLVLSLVPFVYAIQKPKRELFLALSLLGFVIGSVYLFPSQGFIPAVHPVLAVVVSALSSGFVWLVVRKSIQAHHRPPINDLKNLIGQVGLAKTRVHEAGSVQVASELWSARSEKPIPDGSWVKVVKRDGFTLVVERDDKQVK